MDQRQKALEALKKQVKEQRAKMDPALLKVAEKAAIAVQKKLEKKEDTVPFDKKAAAKVIEGFLKDHPDGAGFAKRLKAMLAALDQ